MTNAEISDIVKSVGLTPVWRGNTCQVFNSSGKKLLGAIFRKRDGSYGQQLPRGSVAASALAGKIEALPKPAVSSLDLQRIGDAIRAGTARTLYSDDQILAAVKAGYASEGDALNQDF